MTFKALSGITFQEYEINYCNLRPPLNHQIFACWFAISGFQRIFIGATRKNSTFVVLFI
jgi:hypothetical protein